MIGELSLTTREGAAHPGYLAHVGDIPAISMQMAKGSAFLLPRECFSRLEFKRQHDGRPARLTPRELSSRGLACTWNGAFGSLFDSCPRFGLFLKIQFIEVRTDRSRKSSAHVASRDSH